MFVVEKGLPYYYEDGKAYACVIDALTYRVDFTIRKNVPIVTSILTENEVRAKLGIKLVDSWDAATNSIVKVSNKKVSSIFNLDKNDKK